MNTRPVGETPRPVGRKPSGRHRRSRPLEGSSQRRSEPGPAAVTKTGSPSPPARRRPAGTVVAPRSRSETAESRTRLPRESVTYTLPPETPGVASSDGFGNASLRAPPPVARTTAAVIEPAATRAPRATGTARRRAAGTTACRIGASRASPSRRASRRQVGPRIASTISSSSSHACAAPPGRLRASLSSIRSTLAARRGSTSGATDRSGGTGSRRCCSATASGSSEPWNGRRPLTSS